MKIEHLKACLEIATSRTINWQQFCQRDEGTFVCLSVCLSLRSSLIICCQLLVFCTLLVTLFTTRLFTKFSWV